MWMVERHLKSSKSFVIQRSHPEGYMVEGYMIYQSLVCISQYLPKLTTNMNVPLIWDVKSIKKFEGGFMLGKGRMTKLKGN
jgi:hypothetical protein